MLENSLFALVAKALNPFKILGYIKNSIDPGISVLDSTLGYNDFELSYGGRPISDNVSSNKTYFYKIDNEIYYITRDHIRQFDEKEKLSEQEIKDNSLGIKLEKKEVGEKTYNELINTLDDEKAKKPLTTYAKVDLYSFLEKKEKYNFGYRHYLTFKILKKYRDFEENFINKHPRIVRFYRLGKNIFNNLCTFATSQTGLRIASIATMASLSIASGGTIPIAMVGLYTLGIGVSMLQQANSRMKLNLLEEEADLLLKCINLNKEQKFEKAKQKILEKTKIGESWKWVKATFLHISTYILETAVPLATSIMFPFGGAISTIQIGAAIAASSASMGIGSISRKIYEDRKLELYDIISKVKENESIPNYKNIDELRKFVADFDNSQLSTSRSRASRYLEALGETINPFAPPMQVKDPQKYKQLYAISAMVPAMVAASNPYLAVGSAVGTATALAIKEAVNKKPNQPFITMEEIDKALNKNKTQRKNQHTNSSKEHTYANFVNKINRERVAKDHPLSH